MRTSGVKSTTTPARALNLRVVHVLFEVDEVALWQVFSEYFRLVAGFPPRWPRVQAHVWSWGGFVVDKWRLGRFSLLHNHHLGLAK
jgi:hypothetical protein